MLAEVAGEDIAAMSRAKVPRQQQAVEEPEEAAPSGAEEDLQARLNAVRS